METLKEELNLTPKQQEKISRFLAAQLRTLRNESRLGRIHYDFESRLCPEFLKKDLETAIMAMADTIYE